MGRTTNLYLLDGEGRILDCLRRIGLDDSTRRQALPGLYYQPPMPLDKANRRNCRIFRPFSRRRGRTGWQTG